MNYRTAVCILIERDGKFLAISRRDDPAMWGLPGGKVDANETSVEAAQRELLEETGLLISTIYLEPFCSALAEGDTDYWVTTYLWTDSPVMDRELHAEAGMALDWLDRKALCDPLISPFSEYNIRVFEAYSQLNI